MKGTEAQTMRAVPERCQRNIDVKIRIMVKGTPQGDP